MTQEERWTKYIEQAGRCKKCGKPMSFQQAAAAHIIPRTKMNLKVFGPEIIDHRFNLALTHNWSYCNDGMLMSRAANPEPARELIERIKADIQENSE